MSSTIGLLLCKPARLSQKKLSPLFIIFSLLLNSNTFASNGVDNLGRADYDLDNNGLIEINDLADLDEIRNNLDGKTLYGSNVGCPNAEDGGVIGGAKLSELAVEFNEGHYSTISQTIGRLNRLMVEAPGIAADFKLLSQDLTL